MHFGEAHHHRVVERRAALEGRQINGLQQGRIEGRPPDAGTDAMLEGQDKGAIVGPERVEKRPRIALHRGSRHPYAVALIEDQCDVDRSLGGRQRQRRLVGDAIVENDEILGAQVGDRMAFPVQDRGVDPHHLDTGSVRRPLQRRLLGGGRVGGCLQRARTRRYPRRRERHRDQWSKQAAGSPPSRAHGPVGPQTCRRRAPLVPLGSGKEPQPIISFRAVMKSRICAASSASGSCSRYFSNASIAF